MRSQNYSHFSQLNVVYVKCCGDWPQKFGGPLAHSRLRNFSKSRRPIVITQVYGRSRHSQAEADPPWIRTIHLWGASDVWYMYMFPWIDPYEYVSVYLEVHQVSAEINPIHVVESSSTNEGTIPTNDISRKGGGNWLVTKRWSIGENQKGIVTLSSSCRCPFTV